MSLVMSSAADSVIPRGRVRLRPSQQRFEPLVPPLFPEPEQIVARRSAFSLAFSRRFVSARWRALTAAGVCRSAESRKAALLDLLCRRFAETQSASEIVADATADFEIDGKNVERVDQLRRRRR